MSEKVSSNSNQDVKSLTTCQNCGANDPNLTTLDSGLRLTLIKAGKGEVPTSVCSRCIKVLRKSASQGAQLQAKEEAQAARKVQLWKGRTEYVKKGRKFLTRAEYADSAIAYETYLKIVTLVVEKDRKDLDPKLFNDKPKEITIISSVLWDLMLIYASHTKFNQKQLETAELLSKFLRFSPIYNSVIRKAELQARSAKNPQAFKHLLKLCDASSSRCFVANAVFETRTDPSVQALCQFRDQVLRKTSLGRQLIITYYKWSPTAVRSIKKYPQLKAMARPLLQGVANLLKAIYSLPEKRDS